MEPRAWVSGLLFSDMNGIALSQDDIIVIVGPNNAGKSEALRAIYRKLDASNAVSNVIHSISVSKQGSGDELIASLEASTQVIHSPGSDPVYVALGLGIQRSQVADQWNRPYALAALTRFFCHFLTADERLQAANPVNSIRIAREAPSHPIHVLQRNDTLELKLSQQFRRAFGTDLIVHRNAGSEVYLLVGDRPQPGPGQDRLSHQYTQELEKLPTLQSQGDGMRSFAGVLLHTSVGRGTILLIDEPEAFLHPPQARHLGRMLVQDKPTNRQLFVATHSGDILRGILDSNSPNVRVVRIRRSGDVNIVRELNNERVVQLWSDPLLRYSNILDGVFHEKVVVGEGDSDCRFYAAVMDALYEAQGPDIQRPDIMFTHCGGKSRLLLVIRALRELDVPVVTVTDFDVLSEENLLREIVEAAGGDWATVSSDWRQVKNAIDSKKAELSASEVTREITNVLAGIKKKEQVFPATARQQIQTILRPSSPWVLAKGIGKLFVPSGGPTQACDRLLRTLRQYGIFVVEVGELEGFVRSVGGNHGPSWVNEVLTKDLQHDPELEPARNFVSALIS